MKDPVPSGPQTMVCPFPDGDARFEIEISQASTSLNKNRLFFSIFGRQSVAAHILSIEVHPH